MKQITRELLRTKDYSKAILACKSDKFKIIEEDLTEYEVDSRNKNRCLILKEYLKTNKQVTLKLLGLNINLSDMNRTLAKELLVKSEINSTKLKKYSLEQKENLIKQGFIRKYCTKQYVVYQHIPNQFDADSIKPQKESYNFFLEKTKVLLSALGFKVVNLPWSVSYEDNFSFLNFKRDNVKVVTEKDNYYLGKLENEKSRLLKPHCTGIMLKTIKEEYLRDSTENRKYYSISRVFRKENKDTTHSCFFDQLEITVITSREEYEEILNLFTKTYKEVFSVLGITSKIEIYPTFYPYTTPSLEFYDKQKKLEVGGGGVFNFNYITGMHTIGFALGLERCYMYKHNLKDIKLVK